MNKLVIGVVVAVVIVAAVAIGIFFYNSSTGNVVADNIDSNLNVKTFSISGGNFKFYIDGVENPDIVVKQEDKVRIEFNNEEGFHDWKVDEFNAATEKVAAGVSSSVEFVADKKGTFEYYCSVGQHRANGMKGKLIVQ